MSSKVMGLVWEADLPRDEKFILLSYADHADHNGESVFPSTTLMSWKTGYSVRQIQRITKKLIEKGILIEDGESQYGTNLYIVNMDKFPRREPFRLKKRGRPVKGDILSSIKNNGDMPAEKGDTQDDNGDIAVSSDPSLTIINPSEDNIKKLGGAGFYILDLVGLDYNDADKKTKAGILKKIEKHGETVLCDLASRVVEDYPDIKLGKLFSEIEKYSQYTYYEKPRERDLNY